MNYIIEYGTPCKGKTFLLYFSVYLVTRVLYSEDKTGTTQRKFRVPKVCVLLLISD